jgi:hypothetical protein
LPDKGVRPLQEATTLGLVNYRETAARESNTGMLQPLNSSCTSGCLHAFVRGRSVIRCQSVGNVAHAFFQQTYRSKTRLISPFDGLVVSRRGRVSWGIAFPAAVGFSAVK